jgi:hypothetical protein
MGVDQIQWAPRRTIGTHLSMRTSLEGSIEARRSERSEGRRLDILRAAALPESGVMGVIVNDILWDFLLLGYVRWKRGEEREK